MGMKRIQNFGNFVKGRIDHDLNGRFDLPIYTSGADVFTNFISNYKGNAIFSAGFLSEVAFQDCAFIEFKFGITQNYLCCFYASYVQFLAFDSNGNFGWVLSGSNPLKVSSPYTLADAQTISQKGSYAQNDDVMYLCHRSYAPYKLTRTGAAAFTLSTFLRVSDPFADPSVTVSDTSSTSSAMGAGSLTFTVSSGKGYLPQQPITITYNSSNYMTGTVTSYSGTTLVVNIDTVFGSGTYSSWTIAMTTYGWPGAVCFYQGRLFYGSATNYLTTMWWSNSGSYDDLTVQNPLTDASGFSFSLTAITQQIEWIFPGEVSLIVGATDGIVAINGGSVNTAITASTVQATATSAEPTNGAYPIQKEGLIFYVSRISRQVYYFKYDVLTEAFVSQNANLAAYDITKGGLSKLRYQDDWNQLIFTLRNDGEVVSFLFKESANVNGWHERTTPGTGTDTFEDIAVIGDNNGNPQLIALVNRNGTYYIERQAPYVEFAKLTDFWTQAADGSPQNQYQTMDKNAYIRYISEQLRQCIYLDNAITYENSYTSTLTYDATAGTITSNDNDFASGDVGKHIVYKTSTGYESGRFEITGYTSATVVTVSVLQTPQSKYGNALNTWSAWYKSFTTISGLDQFDGNTVGIVADGGYLESTTISGGSYTSTVPITSVVVGYLYTGIIKSMALGFHMAFSGISTYALNKEIAHAFVRCVHTMGLKVGPSLYALQELQLRSQGDLNYCPPQPVDGTQQVDVVDDTEIDKCFYIVQDQPLPATVTNFMVDAVHATTA